MIDTSLHRYPTDVRPTDNDIVDARGVLVGTDGPDGGSISAPQGLIKGLTVRLRLYIFTTRAGGTNGQRTNVCISVTR